MPISIKLYITFMDVNHEKKGIYLSVGFKIKRKLVLRDCFFLTVEMRFYFVLKYKLKAQ